MTKWFTNNRTLLGLLFTVAVAVACFVIGCMLFIDYETLERVYVRLYDCGIDATGAFICAAIYFGSTRQEGVGARTFRTLVVLVSAGFLVNDLMCFLAGLPQQRTPIFVLVLLSKLVDLAIIFLFYQYIRISLDFKGKLANWANKGIPILIALEAILVLSNIFYPVTFLVDSNALYHDMPIYPIEKIYLIAAPVIATILIIRSGSPRNQKIAALTFGFFPLFSYFMTFSAFGNASNYGMTLMSLVIMYGIIFNYNSEKLVSTQADLNTATAIQTGMVPSVPPAGETFEVHASMNTAKEVGGDFYDCFMIDPDRLCIVIADVSGKGMPAALFMMRGTTVIKDHALVQHSTSEILTAANARLCENNDESMFITAWIGILDTRTMTLQYTNAGHNYPILQRAGQPCEQMKTAHGLFLAGLDFTVYGQDEIKLEPGDRILLYTDGVTEAHDPVNAQYGEERLNAVMESTRQSPGEDVLERILEDVALFARGAPQFDDITMLVLTIKG